MIRNFILAAVTAISMVTWSSQVQAQSHTAKIAAGTVTYQVLTKMSSWSTWGLAATTTDLSAARARAANMKKSGWEVKILAFQTGKPNGKAAPFTRRAPVNKGNIKRPVHGKTNPTPAPREFSLVGIWGVVEGSGTFDSYDLEINYVRGSTFGFRAKYETGQGTYNAARSEISFTLGKKKITAKITQAPNGKWLLKGGSNVSLDWQRTSDTWIATKRM